VSAVAAESAQERLEGVSAATTGDVKMTWYQATRHSFVTRNLENGASLDEVSEAVGHSSPVVAKRFYDHHVRKSFSPTLRAGLAAGEAKAGES
jgi:site-specific recombinase XerD